MSLPWYVADDDDYNTSCDRCEFWVTVSSEAVHSKLVSMLFWDARKDGGHGRCLRGPVPELNLLPGDRLEPCRVLQDVAEFESLKLPAEIMFWRSARQSMCHHKCLLLDPTMGVTLTKTVCIDLLHSLYLGPMLVWSCAATWYLLISGVWGSLDGPEAERIRTSLIALKSDLHAWYSSHIGSVTQISHITPKMIGTKQAPKLKLKAMECYGFMLFLLCCLRKHMQKLSSKAHLFIKSGATYLAGTYTHTSHGTANNVSLVYCG